MTITIGRFGTDISVGNPMQFTRSGDKVQVSGTVAASSKAAMNALIQQINGLKGPDEPVVPLTYSYDSTWDGYYAVEEVQHDLDPHWERTFRFRYSVQLRRFAAYPIVEMIIAGAERAGNPGIAEAPWHAVPSTWSGYEYGATTAIGDPRALTASTNMMLFTNIAAFLDTTATAGAAPAEAYTGAATLKTGSTLYTVTGRAVVNTPSNWELSNGLLKVGSTTGAGNHWTLASRNAAGTAWSAAYGMTVGYDVAGYTPLPFGVTPRSVTVLRNSPEEVTIRLAYQPDSSNTVSVTVDLSLRRGARFCTLTLRTRNVQNWGLGFSTPVACSNVSAFAVTIRETADNADGNRNFVGITDTTPTRDLVNGTIMVSGAAGGVMDGFFGVSTGGAAASAIDLPNALETQYYAAVSEKQRMAPQ